MLLHISIKVKKIINNLVEWGSMEPIKEKNFFVKGEYLTVGLIGMLILTIFGGGIFLFHNIAPASSQEIPQASSNVLGATNHITPQEVPQSPFYGPQSKATPSAKPSPTKTPTPSPSASATASPSPSPSPTESPTPTNTPSPPPTETPTPNPTATAAPTPTSTPSPSPTPTASH